MADARTYTVCVVTVENGRRIGERTEERADCLKCGRSADPFEIVGNGGLCYSCSLAADPDMQEDDE